MGLRDAGGSDEWDCLDPRTAPAFPMAAKAAMGDAQLRKNVRHATDVIQAKRARVVGGDAGLAGAA